MRCPIAADFDTQVKDLRLTEDASSIRRRRICSDCGGRFTTFERVQLRELTMIKRTGRRALFDREKLLRSIEARSASVRSTPNGSSGIVNAIVRQLESRATTEIPPSHRRDW